MRTVDPNVIAAIAADPYFRIQVAVKTANLGDRVFIECQLLEYSLFDYRCTFKFAIPADFVYTDFGTYVVRIERGGRLNGTFYFHPSNNYHVEGLQINQDGTAEGSGTLFPTGIKLVYAGDVHIEEILAAATAAIGYTPFFVADGTQWQEKQWYPAGRVYNLNRLSKLPHHLYQKFHAIVAAKGAVSAGATTDEINYIAPVYRSIDPAPTPRAFLTWRSAPSVQTRKFIWRDELMSVHTFADGDAPLHNLGFFRSDEAPVADGGEYPLWPYYGHDEGFDGIISPPDLTIEDGDRIKPAGVTVDTFFAQVSEHFNPRHHPSWYTRVRSFQMISNTEGGTVPGTIEGNAPYTPLYTGNFAGILSEHDNNVQAAMETIDDHDHTGLTQLTTVYVSKAGDDDNAGTAPGAPVLTIAAAIAIAEDLIDAGATAVYIEIQDAGAYSESFTLPTTCRLIGPAATIIGAITLESDTQCNIHSHYSHSDGAVMVHKVGATGLASYYADIMDLRGLGGTYTDVDGIKNDSNGSVIFARIGQMWVAAQSRGVSDASPNFGHVHFWAADIYLAGNSAIGINAVSNSTNFIGYVDHILETGTPTNTVGIKISNAGAIVKATISEIIADTVYNVSAGTLYLTCPKVTGARTGTPAFEWTNASAGTAAFWNVPAAGDALTTQVVIGTDSRLTNARSPISHHGNHEHNGSDAILLDNLETPEDNTDLNATTGHHGLLPKLDNSAAHFLNGQGSWAVPVGYSLTGAAATVNPIDGTTYYFGSIPSEGPETVAARRRVYIPKAGTIQAVSMIWLGPTGTAPSNENITAQVRLNNTTSYQVAVVGNTATIKNFAASALGVAVAAGDYIEFQFDCPTWGTNPTNVRFAATLVIET